MTLSSPSLRLFGVPALRSPAGEERLFAPERPYQLLAYLACRQAWVARDELAAWLWSDRPQAAARSNLRKVLLLVKRMPGLPPLEEQGGRVRWAPPSDLQAFEAAGKAQRHAEALALYRPPLLQTMEAGLPPAAAEWLAFERERLAALWRQSVAAHLAALADRPREVLAQAEPLLALDPADDTALIALLRAHDALGQPALALQALAAHARHLANAYGLEPPAPLRAMAQALQAKQDASLPAAITPVTPAAVAPPGASRGNVRSLVGRRLELAQIRDWLLREGCTLLTVTGPGGIGKSRLAAAALAALAPDFPGGTWWVPLADLTEATEMPARLAGALSLTLAGDAPPWQQITQHLATRLLGPPALLVLDNVEHLLPALREPVAALLAACPGLRLLAASRIRFSLPEEWLLPLEGLPLPDEDETDPELLRRHDAVRLFEARALAAQPAFQLTREAAAVVRLLHAVEGLPLAIELAAAWVRLLPVAEIAAELAVSLDLLDGDHAAPVAAARRDRSLRASFAHSWQLLGERERLSLAQLAALPAAFSREMALQVAGSPLPVLTALADKSLLRAEGDGRFSLHPLVRQCAQERAAELPGDAWAGVSARHAAYMARWLSRHGDRRHISPRQVTAEIERELPHARAAWAWSLANAQPELIARGTLALLMMIEDRGLLDDGIALFQQAVDRLDEHQPEQAHALGAALRALAPLQYRRGRLQAAEQTARRALRLVQRRRESRFIKISLNHIGLALSEQGRFEEARHCFAQALRRAQAEADPFFCAPYTGNIAMTEMAMGRFEDAGRHFLDAVALHRTQGNVRGQALQLCNAAQLPALFERWAEARAMLEEALVLCEAHHLDGQRPQALLGLGACHDGQGEADAAQRCFTQAREAAQAYGQPALEVRAGLGLARLWARTGRMAEAHTALTQARQLAWGVGAVPLRLKCLCTQAALRAAQGETRAAAALWQWLLAQPEIEADDAELARRDLARLGPCAGVEEADGLTLDAVWAAP